MPGTPTPSPSLRPPAHAINPLATNTNLGFVPGANVGEIQIGGLSTFFGGVNAEGIYAWHYHSYQAGDDFYWTKGAHSIQAGVSYEHIQSNDLGNVTNGFYVFASFQSFITNAPTSFTSNIPGQSIPIYLRQNVYGGYLMDTYHVRKNLTFTVGSPLRTNHSPSARSTGTLVSCLTPTDSAPTVVSQLYQNPVSAKYLASRSAWSGIPSAQARPRCAPPSVMYDTLPLTYLFTLDTVSTAPFGSTANLVPPRQAALVRTPLTSRIRSSPTTSRSQIPPTSRLHPAALRPALSRAIHLQHPAGTGHRPEP